MIHPHIWPITPDGTSGRGKGEAVKGQSKVTKSRTLVQRPDVRLVVQSRVAVARYFGTSNAQTPGFSGPGLAAIRPLGAPTMGLQTATCCVERDKQVDTDERAVI
jgi:hypothetical protein